MKWKDLLNKLWRETPCRMDFDRPKVTSFASLAEREIEAARQNHRYSTAQNYLTAWKSLLRFLRTNNMSYEDINAAMLDNYQHWLKEQGVSLNTISCYTRCLRAIYNKGSDGISSPTNAFGKVFTGTVKTRKRALEEGDIRKLILLDIADRPSLDLTRDLFVFSFLAMGMPFVDMAYLRRDQIHEKFIYYYRHKTHQPIHVPLHPIMTTLLRKYENHADIYAFPILHSDNPAESHRQYLSRLREYNRQLKHLATIANLSSHLSSYVARHTWASIAYSSNVELAVISKALGHTNTHTTLVYVKELKDERLAEASDTIIQQVLKPNALTAHPVKTDR